ncbi:unannotated protein [freshwater metagenome]|uniref:Unannotated protein n=1 Tax=freshwater metagenome TaxID=449393 RepID=A0A6J6PJH2_9ZZZZ
MLALREELSAEKFFTSALANLSIANMIVCASCAGKNATKVHIPSDSGKSETFLASRAIDTASSNSFGANLAIVDLTLFATCEGVWNSA